MAINPLQLPTWHDAPKVDFSPLDKIGDAYAQRQKDAADAEQFSGLVDSITQKPGQQPATGAPPGAPAPGRQMPLSWRNNNPGNIEDGPLAKSIPGYKGPDESGRYATFETPDHGMTAVDALLTSYGRRGHKTYLDVTSRWAPKSDKDPKNDPEAYARFISPNGDPNAPVDLSNAQERKRLAGRIGLYEAGIPGVAPNAGAGAGAGAAAQSPHGMPPEMAAKVKGMFERGGPEARKYAMALMSKYIGKQEPLKGSEGDVFFDPNQVDPNTGKLRIIAQAPGKSQVVREGGAVVQDGKPVFQAPPKPPTDKGETYEQQVAARKRQATAEGMSPTDPQTRVFVLTGKHPGEDKLSAPAQKAIFEAEDENAKLDSTVSALETAKNLNPKIFTGWTASARGNIGTSGIPGANMLLDKGASDATAEWDQIMKGEAIKNMANTLKGASTDFEMRQFVKIISDTSKPPDVREKAIDRILQLAARQKIINQTRMDQLRGGTYYKPGGGQSGLVSSNVPEGAIKELRANRSPANIKFFDDAFGEGAAARVLGGK